jgi:hypothetical protein
MPGPLRKGHDTLQSGIASTHRLQVTGNSLGKDVVVWLECPS